MKSFYLFFLISIYSCSSNNTNDSSTIDQEKLQLSLQSSFTNLSENQKIEFLQERINDFSFNGPPYTNSIFYLLTDSKLIDSLKLKKFYSLPIIVQIGESEVEYKGNRFEDGGLDKSQVGKTYQYGNYEDKGWVRNIIFYEMKVNEDNNSKSEIYRVLPEFSSGFFSMKQIGYHTNSLGIFEVYNYEKNEQLSGIPSHLSDMWFALEYFGNLADSIYENKIDMNKSNFMFRNRSIEITKKIDDVLKTSHLFSPNMETKKNDSELVTSENKIFYHIEDKDGYTNLRESEGGKILRKVFPNENFIITGSSGKFKIVQFNDGNSGYIYESRIYRTNLKK